MAFLIPLQKSKNLIPLKKPEMQGAKFSRNEAYLVYAAVTGKLKQRRENRVFSAGSFLISNDRLSTGGFAMGKVMRKIIEIDEELCNGCGKCVPSCAEGAIQILNGKARIVSERFCDGLGACIGDCPTGALRIVEREAEEFDEAEAHAHVSRIKTMEQTIHCGCPSDQVQTFTPGVTQTHEKVRPMTKVSMPSALSHWPVQIRLVPPTAPFLKGSSLLVAADCVPVAHPSFHRDLLHGRTVLLGCPKFDDGDYYVERLAEVFRNAEVRDVTLAVMEVPCCSAMEVIIRKAMKRAGREIPVRKIVVGVRGDILS